MSCSLTFDDAVDHFLDYLKVERGLAANSLEAYSQDLKKFAQFVDKQKISAVEKLFQVSLAFF